MAGAPGPGFCAPCDGERPINAVGGPLGRPHQHSMSHRITSRAADSRSVEVIATVVLPPVSAWSRQDSKAAAEATPMLVPSTRISLRRPPASPVRTVGAAAMMAVVRRREKPQTNAERRKCQHQEWQALARFV
jgi:hypothetical protein